MFNQGLIQSLQPLFQKLNGVQAVILLLCFYLASQVLVFIYRLSFHPLAKFPGPKLAAATYWYEYYYDVSKKGRFIWQIMDLHRQYGPVVRINPNELHFNDPDFYEEIYHGKKYRTHRDRWYNLDYIGEGLAFTTDHDVHARRRSALSPYFSMQSIRALEPRITDVVATMMDRLRKAHQAGQTVNLYHMFSAYALDIVSQYAFGKDLSMNFINHPEFGKSWAELTTGSIGLNNFARQYKWVMSALMSIPDSLMVAMNPQLARFLGWKGTLAKQVQQILDEPDHERSKEQPTTIFRELIKSDLPAEDKTLTRLADEAQMVLGAGGETTAQSLVRTFYHLLQNPKAVKKLRDELNIAMPEPNKIPPLATLQNLPYLNAVVEEGIRISFPVPARSPRVFYDHPLQHGDWNIAPGTAVSMSPWMVTMNEKVFPDSMTFNPERWVGNKELRRYQVTFGKGRRACLGINLAYAELLFAVAMIFRNLELELFETTWEDVEIVHDFFVSMPRLDRKGVRVKVKAELS
ncbi:hypothetical protein H2200_013002 [Cladophialophora chaetospira]|uniref:Trichodiene oxygenase n=1 Tax=Cladophialophora chaetospira TaxID=386627 RepID=A0AA38WWK5_9EURO|nr:hypothetical protein H2200_013002 [Cladophialophora chaetospira]